MPKFTTGVNPVVDFGKAKAHSAVSGIYAKIHYRAGGGTSKKEVSTQVLVKRLKP